MAKTKTVSFRIPSKYVVFLDTLARDGRSDRTKVLIKMLDLFLTNYLSRSKGQA